MELKRQKKSEEFQKNESEAYEKAHEEVIKKVRIISTLSFI